MENFFCKYIAVLSLGYFTFAILCFISDVLECIFIKLFFHSKVKEKDKDKEK